MVKIKQGMHLDASFCQNISASPSGGREGAGRVAATFENQTASPRAGRSRSITSAVWRLPSLELLLNGTPKAGVVQS